VEEVIHPESRRRRTRKLCHGEARPPAAQAAERAGPLRARRQPGALTEYRRFSPPHSRVTVQLRIARYELAVTRHILPAWENVRLSDVAYADVCQWVTELSDLGLAPSTVRYSHRVFSLMLTHAVRDGRLARNPAEGVKLPKITRGEPMFLDHGQVVDLAAAAEPYGLLVRFLAYTGLRWGEMSALRIGSLDLLRRRMRIKSAFVEVKGKLVEGTPKTHQVRIVPLPRFLVDELAAHVEGKGPDELVFSTPAGTPLRNTNFRRRHWDKAVMAAGLDGLTPHDLRHTAASLAVAAGANVKAVQRMLGHASATMTLDVYAGLFGDDLDTVADLLDQAARRAAADSMRTREATGRVLPFASGGGTTP
jgi:integrase